MRFSVFLTVVAFASCALRAGAAAGAASAASLSAIKAAADFTVNATWHCQLRPLPGWDEWRGATAAVRHKNPNLMQPPVQCRIILMQQPVETKPCLIFNFWQLYVANADKAWIVLATYILITYVNFWQHDTLCISCQVARNW